MKRNVVALVSRIRENANKFILQELKSAGLEELSPSHGDVIAVLLNSNEISMQEIAKKNPQNKSNDNCFN